MRIINFILLISFCSILNAKAIFGADERSYTVDPSIVLLAPKMCSGTLLSRRILITAAHCVLKKDGTSLPMIWLFGSWGTQNPRNAIQKLEVIKTGKYNPKANVNDWTNHSQDWAILKVKKANVIPSTIDFPTVVDPRLPYSVYSTALPVSTKGYPSDIEWQYHKVITNTYCEIKDIRSQKLNEKWNPLFFHDCDLASGDSGGPLFTKRKNELGESIIALIGINILMAGSYDDEDMQDKTYDMSSLQANTAVSVHTFAEELKRIIESNP